MGYLFLIIPTIMWSFVGFFVKTASFTFDSGTITFSRFFFGVFAILLYAAITRTKITWNLTSRFIWLGVIGKSANYLFENMAISIGYSYGNIVEAPLQTVILILASVFYLKKPLWLTEAAAVALCLIGVMMVQLNGHNWSEMFSANGIVLLLFALAALGSAMHVLSQKLLVEHLDPASMNASTFLLASVLVFTPLPFQFEMHRPVPAMAFISLLALGLITAFSFHFYAKALKMVPFIVAVIVGNSGILFTILWAKLFFHEPISLTVWGGTLLLLFGVVLVHWPLAKSHKRKPLKFREMRQDHS
ncbi:DMT family transporter [Ferviditalea candida]|uniref:DMT family transporter n=1 Tax=Ferviditalea candida TaxID=3108399 RepID=A0ABU5ZED2_9BACL|nr:DMT family transporter [Paenibacillaceae bacterium T2]